MDISGSGSFGSNDSLACTKCGAAMYLIRRGPHPTLGTGWEIQIFICSQCHHEIERSADTDGNPHAA
jgi:hypothetical protein